MSEWDLDRVEIGSVIEYKHQVGRSKWFQAEGIVIGFKREFSKDLYLVLWNDDKQITEESEGTLTHECMRLLHE